MKIAKTLTTMFAFATIGMVSVAQTAQKDIVDTAVGAGDFKILVDLVQKAGLVDTLKGKGPFTVFAPTDKAFQAVPKPVLDQLAADKELLKQVLTYHVVPGAVYSKDVKNGMKAKTVQGEQISVVINNGKVKFDNANLVKADIKASNGVIHVIDTVILPPTVAKKLAGGK